MILLKQILKNNIIFFLDNDDSDNFCSVPLPPQQPMADENATCAQRCFIVCVSQVNIILSHYN